MSDSGKTNPSPEHQAASEVVLGTTVDPLVGREVGGYVIEKALGEGGMGLVYQARHPFLGRRFAVKVLRPELAADEKLSSNFVREAQTLSGLKHPHIIDIVGFGPLDGQRQYMVMEFLEGSTLEAELEEHGALPVHRVLELSEEILDGLEAAHSIDVIHRDLKPSNVFLARVSGGTQVVKLLDFGLAKLQPQELGADLNAPFAAARSRMRCAGSTSKRRAHGGAPDGRSTGRHSCRGDRLLGRRSLRRRRAGRLGCERRQDRAAQRRPVSGVVHSPRRQGGAPQPALRARQPR